jgi:hypothetical protein
MLARNISGKNGGAYGVPFGIPTGQKIIGGVFLAPGKVYRQTKKKPEVSE